MKRIVVIGDVIVDEHVMLAQRLSTVEKVPAYVVKEHISRFGGAANVANHCVALGAHVTLVHQGLRYTDLVRPNLVEMPLGACEFPKKARYYVEDWRSKAFKVNHEFSTERLPTDSSLIKRIVGLNLPDIVVCCDNGAGMFADPRVCGEIVWFCRGAKRKIWVDAQFGSDPHKWRGADSIFLNHDEFELLRPDLDRNNFLSYHHKMGAAGSLFFDGKIPHMQHGFKVDAVSDVGAGDAYLAAFAVFEDLAAANAFAAAAVSKTPAEQPTIHDLELLDASFARLR